MTWQTHNHPTVHGVHIVPNGDIVEHASNTDCVCGPHVEFVDPDTGLTYPSGPLIVHHSLDGREANE
jgi:hypothetical protein